LHSSPHDAQPDGTRPTTSSRTVAVVTACFAHQGEIRDAVRRLDRAIRRRFAGGALTEEERMARARTWRRVAACLHGTCRHRRRVDAPVRVLQAARAPD
jgi:hypothetical protein